MNEWRDNGTFRRISDRVVKATVSIAAIGNPRAAIRFLDLTNKVKVIRYGKHKSQFIDMFFPENIQREELSGLIIFVHGGAWGSGATWMYRVREQGMNSVPVSLFTLILVHNLQFIDSLYFKF
jgi:hypothetical protein